MNKKINNFLFFVGLFILYILYSNIAILLLQKIGFNINKLGIHNKNICLIAIDLSLMLITYIIYRKENNRELGKYFRNFKKYFSFGFKMWIIGLILMMSTNILINIFYPAANANNEDAVQEMLKLSPFYVSFSACIFAPFMEEMIFRKSLKKVFNSDLIFIILSGVLFGLVHNLSSIGTISMIYIIPYGLFGSIFAYTYCKTNDIYVPITFHMIHNTVLVVLSLYNIGVIFR